MFLVFHLIIPENQHENKDELLKVGASCHFPSYYAYKVDTRKIIHLWPPFPFVAISQTRNLEESAECRGYQGQISISINFSTAFKSTPTFSILSSRSSITFGDEESTSLCLHRNNAIIPLYGNKAQQCLHQSLVDLMKNKVRHCEANGKGICIKSDPENSPKVSWIQKIFTDNRYSRNLSR